MQFNLISSFLGTIHYIDYRRPAESLLSSIFFCQLLQHFHYPSFIPFPTIFGHMALLPTHIAHSVPSFSSVYIHCIWVSSWTHLSSPSIKCISFSFSSIPFFYSPCYLPLSSPIRSSSIAFSRLCIFPWAHHIPSQHLLFYFALSLISIQPHRSFLPLFNGSWWLFCFY